MKTLQEFINENLLHLNKIEFVDNLNEELDKIKFTNHANKRQKGEDDINYKLSSNKGLSKTDIKDIFKLIDNKIVKICKYKEYYELNFKNENNPSELGVVRYEEYDNSMIIFWITKFDENTNKYDILIKTPNCSNYNDCPNGKYLLKYVKYGFYISKRNNITIYKDIEDKKSKNEIKI